MGFEPMNTGFADQRVSHFAIGARDCYKSICCYKSILLRLQMAEPLLLQIQLL
jgi:hypothetical protein